MIAKFGHTTSSYVNNNVFLINYMKDTVPCIMNISF